MHRRSLPVAAAAVVAAAVVTAILGLGDPTAPCLPAECDCEAVGAGPIRQPANAWSSLSLAAVGIGLLTPRPRRHLGSALGTAVVGSGIAAFLFHASLTDWAARLDGVAVAAVAAVLAAREWSDRSPPVLLVPVAGAVAAAAAAGTAALNIVTIVLAAIAVAGAVRLGRRRDRDSRLLAATTVLLASGGAAWWLGRSGGRWCSPEGPIVLHGVWHVLAAAAVAAGAAYLASGTAPTRKRRSALRS
jgi:hypothetical protein